MDQTTTTLSQMSTGDALFALYRKLSSHRRRQAVGTIMLMLVGALAEVVSVGAILPFLMTVALTALEFLVAFLQAYVFAILTCIYLHDSVHLH